MKRRIVYVFVIAAIFSSLWGNEPIFFNDCEANANGARGTEGVQGKGVLVASSADSPVLKFMVPEVIKNTSGTIAFWFKPVAWNASYPKNLNLFYAASGRNIVRIYKNAVDPKSSLDSKLVFYFGKSKTADGKPGFQRVASPAACYRTGQWTFVAATWSENRINIYANGRLTASNVMVAPIEPVSEFSLGDTSANADTAFDNIAIYDHALSAQEIQALYSAIHK